MEGVQRAEQREGLEGGAQPAELRQETPVAAARGATSARKVTRHVAAVRLLISADIHERRHREPLFLWILECWPSSVHSGLTARAPGTFRSSPPCRSLAQTTASGRRSETRRGRTARSLAHREGYFSGCTPMQNRPTNPIYNPWTLEGASTPPRVTDSGLDRHLLGLLPSDDE